MSAQIPTRKVPIMSETQEDPTLHEYGTMLKDAGFEVWVCESPNGYLVYRDPETGCVGTLQRSFYEGWQHLMPIKPSREHGSSMWLDDLVDEDPWTVEAARMCTRETNRNYVIGTHANSRVLSLPASAARL